MFSWPRGQIWLSFLGRRVYIGRRHDRFAYTHRKRFSAPRWKPATGPYYSAGDNVVVHRWIDRPIPGTSMPTIKIVYYFEHILNKTSGLIPESAFRRVIYIVAANTKKEKTSSQSTLRTTPPTPAVKVLSTMAKVCPHIRPRQQTPGR